MSKTILLADCDPEFVKATEAQLKAEGHTVVTADSCSAADAVLANQNFDMAIVSLVMENADSGFTLAYHIKQKNESTPVIMVSSVEFDSMTDEEQEWTKADTILVKPVRFEQIKAEMQKLN